MIEVLLKDGRVWRCYHGAYLVPQGRDALAVKTSSGNVTITRLRLVDIKSIQTDEPPQEPES